MKYLIVGLGNKGEEYAETRHNIGFKVAEKIAETLEAPFKSANFGWVSEGKYKGRKVFVLKPDTYMNLSGNAVRFWNKFCYLNKNSSDEKNYTIICLYFFCECICL